MFPKTVALKNESQGLTHSATSGARYGRLMNPQGDPLMRAERSIRLYHPSSKEDPECDQSVHAAPPSVLRREHRIRNRSASALISAQ